MTIRRTALTGAAAAAVLTLVAPAGAASADSYTTVDARRDVVKNAGREGSGPDPTRVNGDITTFRLTHAAGRARLVTRFADLTPPGDNERSVYTFVLDASNKHRYEVTIYVGTDNGHTIPQVGLTRDDVAVQCNGLSTTGSYERNFVTATIPRSCLGNPRWLRGGASATTGNIPAPVPGTASYVDDVSLNANGPTGPRVFSSAR